MGKIYFFGKQTDFYGCTMYDTGNNKFPQNAVETSQCGVSTLIYKSYFLS